MYNYSRIFISMVACLMFITGLLNALFPKFMWNTFEAWKSTKEPTRAFFISRRIMGIFIMCFVAFVYFFFPYFMIK